MTFKCELYYLVTWSSLWYWGTACSCKGFMLKWLYIEMKHWMHETQIHNGYGKNVTGCLISVLNGAVYVTSDHVLSYKMVWNGKCWLLSVVLLGKRSFVKPIGGRQHSTRGKKSYFLIFPHLPTVGHIIIYLFEHV